MKYKESKKIYEKIKKGENFILLCHESADLDSIVSNLVLAEVLESMNKKVQIVSKGNIRDDFKFLAGWEKIKIVNPASIDFYQYDTLVALDVSEIERFGIDEKINFRGTLINIDHHEYSNFGDIKLVDTKAGATCTILYYLFKDWGIKLSENLLNKILAGILADTDFFHFSVYSSSFIFHTVAEIIDSGADYEKVLFDVDQSRDLEVYKFWAESVMLTQVDGKYRFAYVVIPAEIYKKYEKYAISSRQISDTFLRSINDTDFGVVIIEKKNGEAKVSIRTRTPGFYVIDLVRRLGGGGHLTGGGATVVEKTFDKSVEKILKLSRKFASENMVKLKNEN